VANYLSTLNVLPQCFQATRDAKLTLSRRVIIVERFRGSMITRMESGHMRTTLTARVFPAEPPAAHETSSPDCA
jgi:hypothetical protein